MDMCIKALGMPDDRSFYTLKEKQGGVINMSTPSYCGFLLNIKHLMFLYLFPFKDSPDDLCPEQQIGTLLTSETKQLELYMRKTVKRYKV